MNQRTFRACVAAFRRGWNSVGTSLVCPNDSGEWFAYYEVTNAEEAYRLGRASNGGRTMTPSQKMQRRNELSNRYRREANHRDIVSPYRQSLYIKARLKGKSEAEAHHLANGG